MPAVVDVARAAGRGWHRRYEIRCVGVGEERESAAAYGVFRGTHTGEGGPVSPTGKSAESDYVYVMEFDD